MGEVVLVNKQKNNTLYHHCTQLGNFTRPNYVTKSKLLAKMTKNLAINFRFVVIQG